ncbi:hypothetical protein AEAC466_17310 [Asticcacaulis sp. AC466]|uniref:DNA primase family protein n=1 Tax=Asticcacaulis sp. AC466 TaxID=1282362 RepID=UPI0003C3DEF4|nr:phage/plasmid primase, P4 family [Asticcacaulis sp. AC466]ESQ82381.1 hypothetical protein AEAC466_17310 [Asticcacaulis sp. AC466]
MTELPTAEELAEYDFNDYGNAMRLIRLAGGQVQNGHVDTSNVRLLYLNGIGWVAYQGAYWDREMGEHHAWRMAQDVGVKMQGLKNELIKRSAGAASDAPIQKFIDSCGSRSACSAMLAMAIPHLMVKIEDFDREPMVLNCANGTVWLEKDKTGKMVPRLRPHNPADRITRYIEVDFDEKARADVFEKIIATALPDADKRDFFHRAHGYSATGHVYEQAFFMCQGLGNDGKSTILSAMRKTLGGYGAAGDSKTFLDIGQQSSAAASPDLAELAGDIRLVVLSEAKRDVLLNEALLKQWTGGEPVPARALHGKPFKFVAIGKLWWQFNGWPKAQGNDDGIWRRLYPIVFEHQIAKKDVDPLMPTKLDAERQGILNWIVRGIIAWAERGLDPPECILTARERYRKQSSPFLDWLDTRCVYGKAAAGEVTSAKRLLDDYKEWATNQGHEKVMSATSFGRAMSERQIDPQKRNGNIYRSPIRLKTPDELALDNAASGGEPDAYQPTSASATSKGKLDFEGGSPFDDPDDAKW